VQNGTGKGMAKAAGVSGHCEIAREEDLLASDQGSCWGHKCSETSLTGEFSSIVSVGASPGREQLPP
jgi:hypothetical protein